MIFKRLPLSFLKPIQVGGHLLESREILLLTYEKNDHKAIAEASPLPHFSLESMDQVHQNAQKLSYDHIEADIERFLNQKANYDSFCKNGFLSYDFSMWSKYPSLQWGLCSLFSSFFRKKNLTGKIFFQSLLQGNPQEIVQKSKELEKNHFAYAKVKVGRNKNERELLQTILNQTQNLKLRLDANASFSPREACDLIFGLERIDYFEEPLKDTNLLSDYYAQSKVPYAIDENYEQFYHTREPSITGLHALILKPTLIGDFLKIEKRIFQIQKLQPAIKLIVSSSYESPLGLKNLCRLAHTLAPHEHHGLDTFDTFLEQICDFEVHQNTMFFDDKDNLKGPIYV